MKRHGATVSFQAAPGEANNITGQLGTPTLDSPVPVVTLTDTGATVTAGAGCEQVDAHSVICRGEPGGQLATVVETGDRADTVHIEDHERFALTVRGGSGNDVLALGSGRGFSPVVDAGSGDDVLRVNNNGDGAPVLNGESGDDALAIPENGGGVMNGGSGDDELDFGGFTFRQRVELRGAGGHDRLILGGVAGEAPVLDGGSSDDTYTLREQGPFIPGTILPGSGLDTLDQSAEGPFEFDAAADCPGCVETLIGSAFDDRIAGDAGAQLIMGGDGADVLDGRGGSDVLAGQAGDDSIVARDGFRDAVTCDEGVDSVVADRFDAVSRSCETVDR